MILLQPEIIDQKVSIFVKDKADIYRATLINQSTKKENNFDIPLPTVGDFDGMLEFDLPVKPVRNTFYTLIVYSAYQRTNYSVCYCGENLSQQYHRLGDMFNEPIKDAVTYNMPVK